MQLYVGVAELSRKLPKTYSTPVSYNCSPIQELVDDKMVKSASSTSAEFLESNANHINPHS